MRGISWVLLVLAGLLSTWLVYQHSNEDAEDQVQQKSRDEKFNFDKFQMAGYKHTQFKDGHKLFTLYCQEIIHRKRKIGPLTVNPVKEIKMSTVRIELFQQGMKGSSENHGPDEHQYIGDNLTPIISQTLVNGLKKMLEDRDLALFRES